MSEIESFLEALYAEPNRTRQIDLVADVVDEWLWVGNLGSCETVLESVDCTKLPISVSIMILTMTNLAKNHLKNRENFIARFVSHLKSSQLVQQVMFREPLRAIPWFLPLMIISVHVNA